MNKLNTFQRNNLITGTDLAAEIPSSSPELRAFVVIGAYARTPSGHAKRPSKFLNAEQNDLRFWIRRYEVKKSDIEKWITTADLLNSVYLNEILSIEQLEREVEQYIQDFSLLEATWKVDNPLP